MSSFEMYCSIPVCLTKALKPMEPRFAPCTKKVLYPFSLKREGRNLTGIWERAPLWDNTIPPDGGMDVMIAEMASRDRCALAK
jgi:hypothetical protein